MGIKTTRNFADFKSGQEKRKIWKQKSYKSNKYARLEFVLFYTTNLQKFLANNFFWVHFFPIISTDLESAQNSVYFWYSYV
jgi:hypothetical protein